jgi:uncharacterized membrane protein (DUF4010 family)
VIILPALPNRDFTQYNLNPTRIWQIVIMVSTIGFVGYFLVKKWGDKLGLWLSGLLGGMVSSTAVSIAMGRMAQKQPERSPHALQAALLASSVMYLRILFLVWIINPAFIVLLWWKFVILAAVGIALSIGIAHNGAKVREAPVSTLQNPFEIRPALVFAAVFVLLSVLTSVVKEYFGSTGILGLAAIVGVTDIDPFILSVVQGTHPVGDLIVSAILIAMMSNTIVKGVYFWYLAKPVRMQTAWRFACWAGLHVPMILWGT